MKNNFLKGLIMGIVGAIGAAFSDMQTMNMAYIGLITFGFTGQYLVKNWLKPSISDALSVDIRDVISGVLTGFFMAISVYAASLLTGVEFTWPALWKAVGAAVVGYFTKTTTSKQGSVIK
jgi:hypothetical protein